MKQVYDSITEHYQRTPTSVTNKRYAPVHVNTEQSTPSCSIPGCVYGKCGDCDSVLYEEYFLVWVTGWRVTIFVCIIV